MAIIYQLVNGITGERIERLYPTSTPGWARRPEPTVWNLTVNVRKNPVDRRGETREGNPNAGLQHRIMPWRDVIAVSWQNKGGGEITLASGIVSSPLKLDEAAGTLTVDTVCARTLVEDRFMLTKNNFPATKHRVYQDGLSWQGVVSEIVRIATTDYEALPQFGFDAVPGFGLPIDRPPVTAGAQGYEWFGYNFKTAAEAISDVEDEAGIVVDFRPYWRNTDSRHRWNLEVFADDARAGTLIDLGSTGALRPQAEYQGTTEDQSGMYTVTHHTGKGSEVDILYDRKSDTTATVMARETLIARPDVESRSQLTRQKEALYAESRQALVQDTVVIHIDEDNPDWIDPRDLWLGRTVQLTIDDSLYYGHATIRRTLVGWKASGDNAIALELQDLTFDSGV